MKLFLSCGTSKEREQQFLDHGFNRLFSQYSDRKKILDYIEMGGKDILLDSGAFSAFNSGKTIDLDGYIEFANSITDYCKFIVNLDVIGGDPQESFNNFVYMRNHLKEPHKLMPVFHYGEDIKWLYKYLDYSDDFGKCSCLGLGGIARIAKTTGKMLLDTCERILTLPQYKDVYVHVFGVTTIPLVQSYSFIDSVDSVTWRMNAAYANVILPPTYTCLHLGHGNTEESVKRGYIPRELLHDAIGSGLFNEEVQECLNALDLTIDDLYDSDKARELFNAYVLHRWAETFKPKKAKLIRKLLST